MKRFAAGFTIALALAVTATVAAAPGDSTVKGNLTVNGSATVNGDTLTRSVQASGSQVISNFGDLFAEHATSAHVTINAGGNGYDWIDTSGGTVGRIIAGFYPDGIGLNLPGPILAMRNTGNGTGELWFESAPGAWTKIAP